MADHLSAKDICLIIKSCKSANVAEITVGGLSLKFHPSGPKDVTEPSQAVSHVEMAANPIPAEQTMEPMNEQALLDAEEAQMLIDDPFAYERSQMLKDLERNRVFNAET